MASTAGAGASAGAGGAGDCEGEEQEDPSSSSNNSVGDATEQLGKLELDEKKDIEDELSVFRQQWQRELESTPSPQRESRPPQPLPREPQPQLTDEEKAKQLFLIGVELERGGKLYEAIQHYKRAIQILPDVETRLYEASELRADTPEEEYEMEEIIQSEQAEDSDDDEDAVEGEELLARLHRILARKGHLFQPEYQTKGAHISWLPYEVVQLVLRWVVGAEMDAASLERAAASCRGLYVAAREPDLWRCMCVKTWGLECGTPRAHGYCNWRQMYVERARLNLHGCYISKTTYLRYGENSFQDHFYRPWYLIDYYRYLRFFPEGVVLMWTTAEEPAACVGHLKHRETKNSLGIMSGHYRLVGDTVVILIKKACSEKTPASTRFRARRKEAEQHEQLFQLELQVRTVRARRNWQLVWRRYAVSTRRDQWSAFELVPSKYPPFAFSAVRHYTADSSAPLLTCA